MTTLSPMRCWLPFRTVCASVVIVALAGLLLPSAAAASSGNVQRDPVRAWKPASGTNPACKSPTARTVPTRPTAERATVNYCDTWEVADVYYTEGDQEVLDVGGHLYHTGYSNWFVCQFTMVSS